MNEWATPLLVLPGVGLLVMSTSLRYARLHDELHHHLEMRHVGTRTVERLLLRGVLFQYALLALYGACALLALSGLAGGLAAGPWVSGSLLGLGVSSLVVATGLLMRETTVSLDVIRAESAGLARGEGEGE